MGFLIDTDIWIYYLKAPISSLRIASHYKRHLREGLFMAMPTYGELLYGAYRMKEAQMQEARIRALFLFARLLPLTQRVFERWAHLKAELASSGRLLSDIDLMIASSALENNLTLVTNNTRHFQRIGSLRLANWKTDE